MINPRRLLGRSEPYVLAAIIVLGLLIQARSGQFFTGNNLVDLVRAMIIPGLLSVGCMMVIVSDDQPEILACASRIVVMQNGAFVRELDPASTTESKLGELSTGVA